MSTENENVVVVDAGPNKSRFSGTMYALDYRSAYEWLFQEPIPVEGILTYLRPLIEGKAYRDHGIQVVIVTRDELDRIIETQQGERIDVNVPI